MAMKIDCLFMGIPPKVQQEDLLALADTDGISISCKAYNLFHLSDLLHAQISLRCARADLVIFYWDINARPAKWMLDLSFPLYGFLGLQYDLLSRVRVPLIVLSPQPQSYFLHADLAAFARTNGVDAHVAESLDQAKQRIRTMHSPPIWGGKKVCIFGRPFKSSTIRGPRLTRSYVLRRTGVAVQYRSIRSLIRGIQGIPDTEARAEMEAWVNNAAHIHGELPQEIMGACKLYLYVNQLIERHGYAGVSISCISKGFPQNPIMPHPCLAFSRFRDRGISAVCEGDVCALLTALLMEGVSQRPSYMGNITFVDLHASTITLTHCVTALKMQGYGSKPMAYSLQDYHDTGKGVVPGVDFPVDRPVTVGLISKDLQRFCLWPGTLIESGRDFCANMAKIRVPDAKGFKQGIMGCHYVMVYGDVIKELHTLLLDLNMTVVGPMAVSE